MPRAGRFAVELQAETEAREGVSVASVEWTSVGGLHRSWRGVLGAWQVRPENGRRRGALQREESAKTPFVALNPRVLAVVLAVGVMYATVCIQLALG